MIDLSKSESTALTTANSAQISSRNKLWQMFRDCKLSDAEMERSLGLFIRGSLLARFLAIADIYKEIVDIPGDIFDLGTWRGQNAVLSENLRSIHEPFNKQRKIICFDTFEGYTNWSDKDRKSQNYQDHTYSTGPEYATYLAELLKTHEGCNALGNIQGQHQIISGDASQTVPGFLQANPNTLIALAFLDLGLYVPTREVLKAMRPHLLPGSVLVFLQMTRGELPGDAVAFREVLGDMKLEISKSKIYPSFSVVKCLSTGAHDAK